MSDLISRQAAIDVLDEIRHALWEIDIQSPTVPEYVEHHEQVQTVWKLVDKKQKELYVLPSAQPEQQWIPVNERLPEEPGTYMTTADYGKYGLSVRQKYYYGQGLGWSYDRVIAWMPLPEPYQPERSGEE